MTIMIGENIKRLRTAKGLTQEQLSEAVGVTCAAVSKWERGDTFPDITMLFPLAHFFGVSLDELMGYDREKIEADIEALLAEYVRLSRTDALKARELITGAMKKYPDDFRVMNEYMWEIAGNYADNDPAVLREHSEEFERICARIIDGCGDEALRLDAWNMRAKLAHACGETDKALAIYERYFSDWYTTGAQKAEQLFVKDTPEFHVRVTKNMYELANFSADKYVKSVFYESSVPLEERVKRILACAESLERAAEKTSETYILLEALTIVFRLANDLSFRVKCPEEKLAEIRSRRDRLLEKLRGLLADDKALAECKVNYMIR